jgi:hypothetical protein
MIRGNDDHRARSYKEMTMETPRPVIIRGDEGESPASRFRRIVRKSALLNVVIVLTSLPVLVLAGGPGAIVPALAVMTGITLVIWTVTFALFSCASIGRLLWTMSSSGTRRKPSVAARRVGVGDRWLDGPG